MKENTVVAFQNPSDFQKDPLTEVLQAGARELLAQAVEAEVSVFLGSHAALVDAAGRRRVVRNGYLPERFIQTGIGPVSVRQPRVRDRGDGAIRFTSAILPRYLRRAKSLEDLLPWLYLKGISTGDFGEALAALLGSSAPGLSASTITRLKEVWGVEAERWQRRDLTAKRYVYFWVDGIYFSARMEEEKQCILVIVGATDKGQKELIAIADGYRESEQSWLEVLLDLKRRGLEMGPQLALGDGALGFWKALRQVYPGAREQRCWVHKTGNVLNKLPKGLQKKAKGRLQDIWMAETRKDAESAFDFFLEAYGPKYDKAAACLAKDRDVLLTFYDFPAEHWKHVRTTNPIESTFATVRLRTYRTKGCLSRKTAMAMVFKLCQCAQRKWRKLDGSNHLAEIIRGVKFVDGEGDAISGNSWGRRRWLMMLCCLHDFQWHCRPDFLKCSWRAFRRMGSWDRLDGDGRFSGPPEAGGGPSERHLGVSPAFDVAGDLAHRAERVLDDVGAGERAPEFVRQAEADDGEDLLQPLQDAARDARFLMLQTPDQVAQEPLGLVCVVLVPGLTERLLDALQMLGQALDDVTACGPGSAGWRRPHRRCFGSLC